MPAALKRVDSIRWILLMLTGLGAVTLVALAIDQAVQSPAAAGWLYLLVVLPVALRWGRALGITTAALAALLVLVLLVEPRFSITVADPRDTSRVALTLGGMILTVLLAQANAGGTWTDSRSAEDGASPDEHTEKRNPAGTAAEQAGRRNGLGHGSTKGHAGCRAGGPEVAVLEELAGWGSAGGRARPATEWNGRRSDRPLGNPQRTRGDGPARTADAAAPPKALTSGADLPAWVCASLLGVLSGVVLAKYGQAWGHDTWHPAAVWGALVVVASVTLTLLAAARYLVAGAGDLAPHGNARLLGILSAAMVLAVGWAALSVIVFAGWEFPPMRPH